VPASRFDRRFKRRVTRGLAEIEARLDLHGLTQAEAHRELIAFLRRARSQGARVVLIITGKGGETGGGGRGVLRRQVPEWLMSHPLRNDVVAIEPAGIGHGGEGALYVHLRRARPAKSDP
jgi:DNA-nicking Smr family endonuclease